MRNIFLAICAVATLSVSGLSNVSEARGWNSYNRGYRQGARATSRYYGNNYYRGNYNRGYYGPGFYGRDYYRGNAYNRGYYGGYGRGYYGNYGRPGLYIRF